eukprot:766873-Rhodomonas_salina.1
MYLDLIHGSSEVPRAMPLRKETGETLRCLRAGSVDKARRLSEVCAGAGKGSTCTMVESILRQQGLKTGLYTSPHLIDVCPSPAPALLSAL